MCLPQPKIQLPALPQAPSPSSAPVTNRRQQEQARLLALGGSASTRLTDLSGMDLTPGTSRRVLLGV